MARELHARERAYLQTDLKGERPGYDLQPHQQPLALFLARHLHQSLAVEDHLAPDLAHAGVGRISET
jgi:hypothetical protein